MVSMQMAALLLAVSGVGDTVLLDFHAEWCGPCRAMDSTVAELSAAGYPVRKVNIDHEPELASRYGVQNIPCFVLVANGKEVGRVVGATSRAELQALFAKARPARAPQPLASRAQLPDLPLQQVSLPSAAPKAVPVRTRQTSVAIKPETSSDPFAQQAASSAGGSPMSAAQFLQCSVRLTIEDSAGFSYGSGTLIDSRQGEALILTCGHIFRDSDGKGKIMVDLFGPGMPKKIPGQLVSYDLQRDVGLVSIRPGIHVTTARVAPKGYRAARGDQVISVGCNNGADPTVQESKVTGTDKFLGPPNIQVAGQPVQGRSGGGLFTPDGLVIGVCNAADPADNEGLFAAAATIQAELDAAGLAALYDSTSASASVAAATSPAAADQLPAMPASMSQAQGEPPAEAQPNAGNVRMLTGASGGLRDLSPEERATLAELRERAQEAEVICIVRPLKNPQAKSEIIVLDRASPAFLNHLASERTVQDARHLTSMEVRRGEVKPGASCQVPAKRKPIIVSVPGDRVLR